MTHVHDGEWCAKCVEHGVVEQAHRMQDEVAFLAGVEEAARAVTASADCTLPWGYSEQEELRDLITALRAALEEKP